MANFGAILGGLSGLDRALVAGQRGTREAGDYQSQLDAALAKQKREEAMSALDMALKQSEQKHYDAETKKLALPPAVRKVKVVGPDGTVSFVDPDNPPAGLKEHITTPAVSGPRTLTTSKGIYQWNADTKRWEPTGLQPHETPRTPNVPTDVDETRKDLKGFQSQQIRAENAVKAAKSDANSYLKAHYRADRPLSQQRTATDSAAANSYQSMLGNVTAAEGERSRYKQKADSTSDVLSRLRAGMPKGTSMLTPAPETATPAPKADPVRAQQEIDAFTGAMQQITDPTKRLKAQQRFNQRMQVINAGGDPDAQ